MQLEEILLLTLIFGILSAGFLGSPIILLTLLLYEVPRSLWSLRGRLSRLLRISTVIGAGVWIALSLLLAFVLGGLFGAILFVFLMGIGIIALSLVEPVGQRHPS